MDSEFKDLGILQIKIDGNIITIEQKTPRGSTIIKRNKKSIPPRRELMELWNVVKNLVTDCVFDGLDECTELQCVSFATGIDATDEPFFDLMGVGVKGLFMGKHGGSFAVKILRDDEILEEGKKLYVLAADYFNGKNAQLEMFENPTEKFVASAFKSGAESVEISTGDRKYGVKITKDGIEKIKDKKGN